MAKRRYTQCGLTVTWEERERMKTPTVLIFDGSELYDANIAAPEAAEHRWPARSGPFGKGPAPPGLYRVGPAVMWAESEEPYTDQTGLCWWAPLAPKFKTKRGGLGIHPDGNVPGTAGCIGLTEPNTRDAYEFLRFCKSRENAVFLVVL